MEQLQYLRGVLAQQSGKTSQAAGQEAVAKPQSNSGEHVSGDVQEGVVNAGTVPTEEPYKWGRYAPNLGFKIADTDRGDLSVSIYTYARCLNQLGLAALRAALRWNTEFLYLHKSAVGYTALPYPVGGDGPVFHTSGELAF
jgi:hypothetical protein